jgi:hypothetical protein
MKKAIIVLLLAVLLLMLTACSDTGRVRIAQNSVWIDNLVLSIRHGYKIAEDAYSIAETDNGYDIIIHAVKEGTE